MTDRASTGRGMLKRRGFVAGAAALAGLAVAKLTSGERAEAAHDSGGTPEVLHAQVVNTTTGQTRISANLAFVGSATFAVLNGENAAFAFGDAIQGRTIAGGAAAGVYGSTSSQTGGFGVVGTSGTGAGVLGTTDSNRVNPPSGPTGVFGQSAGGTGVRGNSTTGVGSTGISQDAAGVYGFSNTGPGVYANSGSGPGFFATSTQTAVWGRSGAGTGVFGQATSNGIGVYGAAGPGGYAGYFEGNVYISGGLAGGDVSSSLVQARDGGRRAVYSVDSTEPVVEDFGEGTLASGRAQVGLDADFSVVIDVGPYHVFLTEGGDYGGIYVHRKDSSGFEVRARNTGAGGPFSYRVVAKRKGTAGKRLEKLERPKGLNVKDLEPPKLPEMLKPEPTKSEPTKPDSRDAR